MSLRRTLVLGMLVVMIGAVVTTDVVTTSYLRSFLYGRIDEQADAAQSLAYTYLVDSYQRALATGDSLARSDPSGWLEQLSVTPTVPAGSSPYSRTASEEGRPLAAVLADRLSPDVYVEVLGAGGKVLFNRPSGSADHADPAPVLPAHMTVRFVPPAAKFGTGHGVYLPDTPTFTTSAQGQRGDRYRGEAVDVPGGVLVTVVPLLPTQQTLASLTRIELVVSVVVLALLLAVTLAIVRIGLRPLEEMTATARAIAAGDMRRRIRRTDERSEVGRLGGALNGMLGQIDSAMAERRGSEERLRRFVTDASHELRTPLTSIRGYAELLNKDAFTDDGSRRRAVQRIEHEAARMGALVDELSLLARLDQGRPLERAPVDFTGIVDDAVEGARASDQGRPIKAQLTAGICVAGDALRLRQVVDNLLENALVHTPPGTAVYVKVERAGDMARLVVADDGPGLGSLSEERVFDRFYRGSDARTRPGTGLGLSIVAALARAHGGDARATAAHGGGARFVVELPLAEPRSDAMMAPDARRGTTPARS